jgi:hypothetical protein
MSGFASSYFHIVFFTVIYTAGNVDLSYCQHHNGENEALPLLQFASVMKFFISKTIGELTLSWFMLDLCDLLETNTCIYWKQGLLIVIVLVHSINYCIY